METGVFQLAIKGYQGQDVPFEVPYLAFPTTTGRIIIHAPGTGESHEGRGGRYVKLGEEFAANGVASLVVFKPPSPDAEYKYRDEPYSYRDASWNRIFIQGMARTVVHCFRLAQDLCGNPQPHVSLSGFSAGASVCLAVAPLFPRVDRVLLLSAYDSVGEYFYQGMREYQGEIYAVVGELDPPAVVLASMLGSAVAGASAFHLRTIPGRRHGLDEKPGDSTVRDAFHWAFASEGASGETTDEGAAKSTVPPTDVAP